MQDFISHQGLQEGAVLVFVTGSTAAVTTIEYEKGVIKDLQRTLEKIVPSDDDYAHNERWGDGNGFSHVRAAFLKPSLMVPFIDKQLLLGVWQQIVVLNLDNRSRERTVILTLFGCC